MRFKVLSSAVIMALAGIAVATPALNASDTQQLVVQAQQGNADAQRKLGEAILNGDAEAIAHASEGLAWLERAAAGGDPRAHFTLYKYYVSLRAAPSVNQARKRHLEQAATLGHPLAQAYLADELIDRASKSTAAPAARNSTLRTALRLMQLAASAESRDGAYANLRLADLYFEGRWVKQSESKGLALLRRAAARGEPLASYRVAGYHLRDPESPQYSLAVGLKALQDAAEGGYADAVLELAERHMYGDGVNQDLDRAAHWAQRGASAEDPAAIELLDLIQREQASARVRAAERTRQAEPAPASTAPLATTGVSAPAQAQTRALALAHGPEATSAWTPVSQASAEDTSAAFQALREENRRLKELVEQQQQLIAALTSQRDGLIAQLAEKTGGATEDSARAHAAEVLAQQGMQAMAAKDYTRAAALFGQAGKRGHAASWNNMGILYSQGWGLERDPGAALRSFRRAADLGEARGALNIAYMYRIGRGVRVNIDRSLQWYERAEQLGSAEAATYLASWKEASDQIAAR